MSNENTEKQSLDAGLDNNGAVSPSQGSDDVEKQLEAEPKPEDKKDEEEDGKIGGRSKAKVTIIMISLCLALFLAALDITIITTALPTISEDFHTASGYTWIGSAFLLANAASIPLWGKISDIFGRKIMLLTANVTFMIGSLIAALSYNIGMLITARAIQGIGGGGLIVLVNIAVGDLFPLRIRSAFYGLVGGVWATASSIGPIIGGAFTEFVTWRWCFYINLPLDGIAFFLMLFFLDLKTEKTPLWQGIKAIDWLGALAIVGGTLMFLLGLQFGGSTAPWDSAETICLILFGVLLWVAFVFWQWKGPKYPIIPLRLFKKATTCATLACVFFHGLVFISGSYYLPLYFQAILGATPILSGVYLLPTALSMASGSLLNGFWTTKTGKYLPPIYIGFVCMTVGYGLFINLGVGSSWAKIILYQIVAGFGVGALSQAPNIALQAHIDPRDVGTGTATLGFLRLLANGISVVIGQVVFQNQMDKKQAVLVANLGPSLASKLSGANAGANTQLIDQLPSAQQHAVRTAFAESLSTMWIMYCCFAGAGCIAMFFIKPRQLSNDGHVETRTGLNAEKENAAYRAAEAKKQTDADRDMSKDDSA